MNLLFYIIEFVKLGSVKIRSVLSMTQSNKYKYKVVVLLIILSVFPIHVLAASNELDIPAKSAIAVDFDTGKILYEKNSSEVLPIASMTKLISAYLVYESVKTGKISWNDSVPFDDTLIKMTENPDLSNIPIKKELTYTVEDSLKAMLISSANVSTTGLARLISGTEQAFVDQMNLKVDEWGIKDAHFISASGLDTQDLPKEDRYPNSKDDDANMMSAKSMVIVAKHLITDYPEVLDITKQSHYTLFQGTKDEQTYWSSNLMLPDLYYYTKGVDGLKTGTTPNAGACFIGSTVQDGHRIITVVMNVDEKYSRFEVTKNILKYIETYWEYQEVNKAGSNAIVEKADVPNGKVETVPLIIKNSSSLWVNKQTSELKQVFNQKNDKLSAPLKKNNIVGQQVTTDINDKLGYLDQKDTGQATSDVMTKTDVLKANIFVRAWRSIKNSIK